MNAHPSNWLNPRRRRNAETLLKRLRWHGGKVYLPNKYPDLCDETQLDRFAVNGATQDLYELGCIDIHAAGESTVLIVLSPDLDDAAGLPASAPAPAGNAPKNHVVVVRKGDRK